MQNLQNIEFKIKQLLSQGTFWSYKSILSWNWMEFSEHKEYNFWDPVKDIDWKASAKWNKIYIKKYEEDKDLNILFVFDFYSNFNFWIKDKTKLEVLKELFYSLALVGYYNNDNIWGVFIWDNIENISYKKEKENIYNILWKIDEFENKINRNKRDINKIFQELIKRRTKHNLIFIFTDFIWEIDLKSIKALSYENDIIYINIFDDFELDLSFQEKDFNIWNISLNFLNNFLNIKLDKNIKKQEYSKNILRKIKLMEVLMKKNRIWYFNIKTSDNIFRTLIKYFNK